MICIATYPLDLAGHSLSLRSSTGFYIYIYIKYAVIFTLLYTVHTLCILHIEVHCVYRVRYEKHKMKDRRDFCYA